MQKEPIRDAEPDHVRFDRWLWAARIYKTRSLAAQAVTGGKARLNDLRVKVSAPVRVGDTVRIRKGPYEYRLVVRALSERRGPAREATALYEETESSRKIREERAFHLQMMPKASFEGKGRPTKKERRDLDRLRDRE